jgi:ribosomal protein S18 acetylase RimI-like enzyme
MGMSVTISAASGKDAEQIFRLQYLCFQREAELHGNYRIDPLVQTLDELRAELATDCVMVARLGEEVVGSVRGFAEEEGDTGRIGKLCVHPRLQGHGLGARLLGAVERELSERLGARRFQLNTSHRSESNLRLYRKAGYQRVGDTTGADGIQLITLEKDALAQVYVASA